MYYIQLASRWRRPKQVWKLKCHWRTVKICFLNCTQVFCVMNNSVVLPDAFLKQIYHFPPAINKSVSLSLPLTMNATVPGLWNFEIADNIIIRVDRPNRAGISFFMWNAVTVMHVATQTSLNELCNPLNVLFLRFLVQWLSNALVIEVHKCPPGQPETLQMITRFSREPVRSNSLRWEQT